MQQLYHHRALLSIEECHRLVTALRSSRAERTGVVKPGTSEQVYDEGQRKTLRLNAPENLKARVTYRLMSLKSTLEEMFELELQGCQAPQFLAYQPGDFFERHRDIYADPQLLMRVRRLSAVLFLNAGGIEPAGYTGGELVLYPLRSAEPDSEQPEPGEICRPESGELVVFRPERAHEVRPVLSGMRYTVVSWYY